jgi:hypothetical protein
MSGSCEHDVETSRFVRDKQATSKVADNKMKPMKYRAPWPHIWDDTIIQKADMLHDREREMQRSNIVRKGK